MLPLHSLQADSKHRMVAGVAAQERPIVRNEGSHQDLSGSQEAIAVAYPVCTPDNLPAHVSFSCTLTISLFFLSSQEGGRTWVGLRPVSAI